MKQIASAGVAVVALSWSPPHTQDPAQNGHELPVEDGSYTAASEGLQVALHVEPYEGRTASTLRRDLRHVAVSTALLLLSLCFDPPFLVTDWERGSLCQDTYLHHPGLQLHAGRPVSYLYDQYRFHASEWATIFNPSSTGTIRGTERDGTCLVVERSHLQYAVDAHCGTSVLQL